MTFLSRKTGASTFLFALLGAASLYGQDPVALINQPLVPTSAVPGSAAFTLTVNGTGFTANSIVHWNGNAQTTTFVNSSQLTAAISAGDVATATTAQVGVDNPAPGGSGSSRSNIVFFQVADPTTSVSMSETDYGTGLQPQSVATGDFNADGQLDLAVANFSDFNVSILLGNPNGSFTPQAQSPFATVGGPICVITRDFNGDGKLDLAVANNVIFTTTGRVSILLGNGDGSFQTNTPFVTGPFSQSVTAGDFNGDGMLDLATTSQSDDTVSILLGNGNGTFSAPTSFAVGTQPSTVTTGDFNGDGKLDLAVANQVDSTVSVLLGNGNGTFQPQTPFAVGLFPYSVTAADFNGDGMLDLAAANFSESTVSILLGNGAGSFTPQAQGPFATGFHPYFVTTGDFNGDGKLDLAVANGFDDTVSILLGNGDGSFQPQDAFATGASPISVSPGDFNGDGKLDLAVANLLGASVSVLLQAAAIGPAAQPSPTSLAFGNQVVNTTSGVMQVTLTNTGTATLTLSSLGISGADAASFALDVATTTCTSSSVLAVNDTCTVGVTFSPAAGQGYSASLDIGSDATNTPTLVPLTGTGVSSAAAISVAPANLDFGAVLVGTTTSDAVTVTNTGTADLTLSGIAIGGTDAANFAVSASGTTCVVGTPIAVDASCFIAANFTTLALVARNATLTITSDASNFPTVNVPLTGTGWDFSFDVQPAGSTSATVSAGQTAVFKLQLVGTPGASGMVTLACMENIPDAACGDQPNSVLLNGTTPATFIVSLATTAPTTVAGAPLVNPNSGSEAPKSLPVSWIWVAALALILGTMSVSQRRARLAIMTAMLFVVLWSSCVGSSPRAATIRSTPAGVYTVKMTATASGVTKTFPLTVTVN